MQDVAANANCRTDTVPTLTYATAQGPAFLWRPWLRLLPLLIAIVATEFAAAVLSHYTIGEIASAALMLLAGAVGFATFLTSFFHRRAAALIAIVMFLVIVPYQGMLGIKWLRLSREADRIINYVQTQKQATSAYPSDLSRYAYRDSGTAGSIQYSADSVQHPNSFCVWYSIGSSTTAHSYTPDGGWFYYPD